MHIIFNSSKYILSTTDVKEDESRPPRSNTYCYKISRGTTTPTKLEMSEINSNSS